MKTFALNVICMILLVTAARAAIIEERSVPSAAMKRELPATIVLPDTYTNSATRLPVLYLLHGASGDHRDWVTRTGIKELCDTYGFIIVCPNGETSWYFDAPLNPEKKYETYVAKEVVAFMDAQYRTVADRRGRAIAGLSMGGHGALWLAIRHRDVFGAAGSMSGGVDIRPFPNDWQIKDWLGEQKTYAENWESHTVINQVDSLKTGDLALVIECGTEDFFCKVNRDLHAKLLSKSIAHDYTERPGSHSWQYWGNAIQYQALFFHKYFYQVIATASSVESPKFQPSNAMDGATSTYWSSKYQDDAWLAVDLGISRKFTRITIIWEAAYAKAFAVQVSTDGQSWTEVYKTADGKGGTTEVKFPPAEARHVRVLCTQRGTQWGNAIRELTVEKGDAP